MGRYSLPCRQLRESDPVTRESVPAARPMRVLAANGASQITSDRPLTHDEIARVAYDLWQARGCPQGSPEIDWQQAEQQLRPSENADNSQSANQDFPKKTSGAPSSGRTANRSRAKSS